MEYEQITNRFTGAIMCGGLSLKVVIEKHVKWLRSEDGGQCADLRSANLGGADLRSADLRSADLGGADLRSADLGGANLGGANLRSADLRSADLGGADLRSANLGGADGKTLEGVPSIKDIHQTVYAAASASPKALDMSTWHSCETTHCRAGWVVHLAGDAGRAMEYCLGPAAAAALIYLKSDPKMEKIPDFHCGNEAALADMKLLAEQEAAAS